MNIFKSRGIQQTRMKSTKTEGVCKFIHKTVVIIAEGSSRDDG